jgi:hypothetical protein
VIACLIKIVLFNKKSLLQVCGRLFFIDMRKLPKLPQEDKLDVYRAFYLGEVLWEPDKEKPRLDSLTKDQREMFEKYSRAWSLMNIGHTKTQVANAFKNEFGLERAMAYRIANDAELLLGKVSAVNKAGRTAARSEYAMLLSNLARKDKNYEAALSALKEANRLDDLYTTEKAGMNPKDWERPGVINFINNVNILKKGQRDDDE